MKQYNLHISDALAEKTKRNRRSRNDYAEIDTERVGDGYYLGGATTTYPFGAG
jgi:hypothetical protein